MKRMKCMINKRYFVLLVFLNVMTVCAKAQVSHIWQADNNDGTYKNPVLFADYSDPDVIRIGDDYYMVASSFNCMPGLPILHSKDLVNWQLINHAIKKLSPENVYDTPLVQGRKTVDSYKRI